MKIIIDNGHGGLINGVYQTAGKQSPDSFGQKIYEGVYNRRIANLLAVILKANRIDYELLVPENKDISLKKRVARANRIYRRDRSAFLLSIHLNAGGGTGFEVYTSKGETKSDEYATNIYQEWAKYFPEMKMRPDLIDGDVDKESSFYILRKTRCPALLVECSFMDNKKDYEFLLKRETPSDIAVALFYGLKKIIGTPATL